MDRQFAFAGAIPQNTDVLSTNKNALYGLGYALQAALGTTTCVIGLVGAQTTVPSLQITIGPGAIHALSPVDATAYGDLGTDANSIVKQGILKAAQTLTLTAPTTSGYSQVYLVEAAYQDVDGGATVLPYYNSSNPSAPYEGPDNAGTSNYTVRQGACIITLKAGTAAPTGSQTTPSTDAGYVPLYTITLANGQTAITTAQIITATGAPFVPYNLNNLPFLKSQTDTGTANALVVTEPAISALFVGLTLTVKKSAAANTGATTLNVNGLGSTTLVWSDGSALAAGDWPASVTALLEYDGVQFNLLSVMGPSVFARKGVLLNVQTFTASGTYTKTPGTTTVVVEMVGGGASGGSVAGPANASLTAISGGGSGGTYGIGQFTATAANGATITIGAAGAVAAIGNNAGNAGGASSFGALMSCPGGVAGLAGSTVTAPVAVGGNSAWPAAPTGANLGYLQGGVGGTGIAVSSSSGSPARGGDSFFGRGGQAPYALASGGVGYGSGGSGVIVPGSYSVGVAGGSATPGFCRVWEYA